MGSGTVSTGRPLRGQARFPQPVETVPDPVSRIGEVRLIERLRRVLGPPGPGVRVGIGDDAAVLTARRGWTLLASDMCVEGVHFRLTGRAGTPPEWVGWKALAVNVSDIAAMGGLPQAAVVSLGAPPQAPVREIERIYRGLRRCAKRFGISVVGGDTVRAPRLVIDVAILGTVAPGRAVLRSGARVGDALFVTGRLGGSYASGRHARFVPRVREAQALLKRVRVHAMMDLSDGLALDLWQMARASRVTLRIEAARIPRHAAAKTLHHALQDGEDFELLFAVAPRDAARVPRRLGACPVTRIGRVVRRGAGVELAKADGRMQRVRPSGFRHF